MLSRNDIIRLRHMMEAAEAAVEFIKNKTRDDLSKDKMLSFAITRAIEIMGEAAANVSQDGKITCKDLPWSKIVGMRNRIVHAYFDVNLDILWATIMADLPPLILQLKQVLASQNIKGDSF